MRAMHLRAPRSPSRHEPTETKPDCRPGGPAAGGFGSPHLGPDLLEACGYGRGRLRNCDLVLGAPPTAARALAALRLGATARGDPGGHEHGPPGRYGG